MAVFIYLIAEHMTFFLIFIWLKMKKKIILAYFAQYLFSKLFFEHYLVNEYFYV